MKKGKDMNRKKIQNTNKKEKEKVKQSQNRTLSHTKESYTSDEPQPSKSFCKIPSSLKKETTSLVWFVDDARFLLGKDIHLYLCRVFRQYLGQVSSQHGVYRIPN